jgi:hypothetical protein
MDFNLQSCLERGTRLLAQGATDEEVLNALRGDGASMKDSVLLIHRIKGISLGEAQQLVHCSHVWADQRENQERLNEVFRQALEELAGDKKTSE